MRTFSELAIWLEGRKWGMRVLAATFIIISPISVTYLLWSDEWEDIKEAYHDAWEAFKSGEQ